MEPWLTGYGGDVALEDAVATVARQRHRWMPLVGYTEPRLRLLLEKHDDMELRLLTWAPGQGTGFHDHGGSSGCFLVVQGSITETIVEGGERFIASSLEVGQLSNWLDDIIHDMTNTSTEGAVTIHAYRPVLTNLTRYEVVDGRLRPLVTAP
jgi:predicted metal-dependent enzyme (double-stranded beta helix superfamily)